MATKKTKNVGEFAGIPYDFRKPSKARFKARVWNPEAPFVNRRWWGWGYDFNFYAIAHPHKWRQTRKKH